MYDAELFQVPSRVVGSTKRPAGPPESNVFGVTEAEPENNHSSPDHPARSRSRPSAAMTNFQVKRQSDGVDQSRRETRREGTSISARVVIDHNNLRGVFRFHLVSTSHSRFHGTTQVSTVASPRGETWQGPGSGREQDCLTEIET